MMSHFWQTPLELFFEALSSAGDLIALEFFEGDAIRIGHDAISGATASCLGEAGVTSCAALPCEPVPATEKRYADEQRQRRNVLLIPYL